jgi:hypothetical protein
MSNLNKQFGNNHGDLRGQSAGEYYPLDVLAVGDVWLVVDYRNNVDNQIAEAKANHATFKTPHAAEWAMKEALTVLRGNGRKVVDFINAMSEPSTSEA